MKSGKLLRSAAALVSLVVAPIAWSLPVALDTTSASNGITDIFSATFDGALSPCTPIGSVLVLLLQREAGAEPADCRYPDTHGGRQRRAARDYPDTCVRIHLDLTLNGPRTQLTIAGGVIAFPDLVLTIQGGTTNSTVVAASGAGVVFSTAPQVAAVDANGRAEFLVNLAPSIAVDFSAFSLITAAPNGSCAGPLCAIIPILTLDMVRYRLVIDYDPTFTHFTASFIGQTGNNSIVSVTMNSAVPESLVVLELQDHNQRTNGGTLSTLKWKACTPVVSTSPCLSTNSGSAGGAWTLADATPSNAVWTWDAATGILSMTGVFQTTSFISSNANGSPVISDKVVDLVIDTVNDTTTATAYHCVEGTFLIQVGANGCLNTSTGANFVDDSLATYNVGGNATCVQRTIGSDDESTGNPRGVTTSAGRGPLRPD